MSQVGLSMLTSYIYDFAGSFAESRSISRLEWIPRNGNENKRHIRVWMSCASAHAKATSSEFLCALSFHWKHHRVQNFAQHSIHQVFIGLLEIRRFHSAYSVLMRSSTETRCIRPIYTDAITACELQSTIESSLIFRFLGKTSRVLRL